MKTKNRKQQIIPLSQSLAEILVGYLEIRGNNPDDYLFCNIYGEKGNIRSFEDLVAKYNHERGVEKTSIHLFRHTFAKHWICLLRKNMSRCLVRICRWTLKNSIHWII